MNKLKYSLILGASLFVISSNALAFTFGITDAETTYINTKLSDSAASGASRIMCMPKLRCSLSLTGQFYSAESAVPVWSSNDKLLASANDFIKILKYSYLEGLNPTDYHTSQIESMVQALNTAESKDKDQKAQLLGDLDVTLTDAFFLYAKHMTYGRIDTASVYPDWIITKRSANLSDLLNQLKQTQNLNTVLTQITPRYTGYLSLKSKLDNYYKIAKQGGWEAIPVGTTLHLGSKSKKVAILKKHLALLGYLSQTDEDNRPQQFDKATKNALIQYQKDNAIAATGVVDRKTLQTLNLSVYDRIKQIEINLDRLRWLPLDTGSRYVLVNIPDFSLSVYQESENILSMPVIVGKGANRSCVLSSKINYLELNPYWNIPDSIARKEILPKLQQDPGYASKEHIRVFTSYDSNATEINPLKVNWKKIEPASLTYKFRQEPGTNNSLGRVKFIFPNDCGIYLHDTPTKYLFDRNRRDLSHGCIRIGKPFELADYLLSDKPGWDDERIDAQVKSGKRQVVTLVEPMPVHILYATTWVNDNGHLVFRNDIYGIDNIDYPVYKLESDNLSH